MLFCFAAPWLRASGCTTMLTESIIRPVHSMALCLWSPFTTRLLHQLHNSSVQLDAVVVVVATTAQWQQSQQQQQPAVVALWGSS